MKVKNLVVSCCCVLATQGETRLMLPNPDGNVPRTVRFAYAATAFSPYGVVTDGSRSEYAMHDDLADLIKVGGMGYERVDWDWRVCQKKKGGAFDFSKYDKIVEADEARGITVLPIVYGPPSWAYPAWQNLDGYAAFVRETVRRYGKRIPVIEVWNEANIPIFWKDPNPTNYLALLKAAYTAAKEGNPSVRVALGGTSGWAHGFIRSLYALGAKEYFDIMNVHPYCYPNPPEEPLRKGFSELRKIMTEYGDANKPIWFTEIGWPTHEVDFTGPGNVLLAGLNTARPEKKIWNVICAVCKPDDEKLDQRLAKSLLSRLPLGSKVHMCGPKETCERLAEGGWDAVVYPPDESYPADTLDAVVEFVRRGGTLIDLGGMPMWKPYRNLSDGSGKTFQHDGGRERFKRLRIGLDSWWLPGSQLPKDDGPMSVYATPEGLAAGVRQSPTGFSCGHFFSEKALMPGDRMVPLIAGTNPLNGKPAVAACTYLLDSDMKGRVVVCGIMRRGGHTPVSERLQGVMFARAMGISFAEGVEAFFWFSLRAREKDRFYSEDNFGMTHANLVPKDGWLANKMFITQRPAGSVNLGGEWRKNGLYFPQWKRPDRKIGGMIWTDRAAREVTLTFDADNVVFHDMWGKPAVVHGTGRTCRIAITDEPVYFTGGRLISALPIPSESGATLPMSDSHGALTDCTFLDWNNSGTDWLHAALSSRPVALDWDGDGDLDLLVSASWRTPRAGTWLFENPGAAGRMEDGLPVFKPGRRVDDTYLALSVKLMSDGRTVAVRPGGIARDFTKTGMAGFEPVVGVPPNVHWSGGRNNNWDIADYDGDGRDDLIISIGEWGTYGWDNAYTVGGAWTNGPLRGFVYWVRNESRCAEATAKGPWGKPQRVCLENGLPLETWCSPCALLRDWDDDGDLDIVACDFMGNYLYFENAGSRKEPVWRLGRHLRAPDGTRLHTELCIPSITSADWDGDGKMDFLSGEEDGRVAWYRNTGHLAEGMPVFEKGRFFRQEAEHMTLGALCTPFAVDWDGDGDQDLICGDSAGHVAFIENLSGPRAANPRWAAPVFLSARGKAPAKPDAATGGVVSLDPIRIMAGPNGSIQGPCESEWGYTCLSVADWDGDGLPDVMVNTIWGKPLLFPNVGSRMTLGEPRGVEVEWSGEQPRLGWGWTTPQHLANPKELLTQWRTTPVMADWNGDGLVDLLMLDHEGYLAFFERARASDGRLILKHPQRVFLDADGKPMRLSGRWRGGSGGGSGRRKLCLCDWDGDGRTDIILNGKRNVTIWLQTGVKDGTWRFRETKDSLSDWFVNSHDPQPTACDFDGDGVPDLIVGAEDGYFYHFRNPRSRPLP